MNDFPNRKNMGILGWLKSLMVIISVTARAHKFLLAFQNSWMRCHVHHSEHFLTKLDSSRCRAGTSSCTQYQKTRW